MVDRNEAFVREVDEDMRRDQFQQLWSSYGVFIVGAAVLLLAAIAGYKFWENRRVAQADAAGAQFAVAMQLAADGKGDEALKQFDAIAKGSAAGYQTLARLQLANGRVKAGQPAEALPLYDALAKDTSTDAVVRDFSALQAALLRLDTADWNEMELRLTPLLVDTSPWRAMAREALGLAAYKAGKTDESRKLFEQMLGDRMAPPSVSERALLMLALLTDAEAAKAASQPAKAPDKTPDKTEKAAPAQNLIPNAASKKK